MLRPQHARIFDCLGVRDGQAVRIEEESFASHVYRLERGKKPEVLKFFYNPTKFWREKGAFDLLAASGRVPAVLEAFEPEDGFAGALLLEFAGRNLSADVRKEVSTVREAGRLLAELHGFSLGPSAGQLGVGGTFRAWSVPGWWSYRRDLLRETWGPYIRRRMPEEFLHRCWAKLDSLSASFSDSEPSCLTHCDFRFGNLLERPSGPLAVIDFESSRQGDGAYDFVKIWEDLAPLDGGRPWQEFLDGYASVRPLPAQLDAKLRYYWFDLNYGFLYWAIDRSDEPLFTERLKIVEGLLGK